MSGKFEGLTDIQWMILMPLLPELLYKFGRPRPDRRKLLNTILYVLITGSRWCDIPTGPQWAKRSTAHEYLGKWEQEGVMYRIKQGMLEVAELNGLIDWKKGSVDGSFSPW